ncbi:diaminopimelate decarboxylase [Granulicella tundricola MP5ACTX9]|uniref:Diaminopimelate decarboxylase n=1 Tax=Granulicella tundricola (strain ATCC BAA-1859 / DSM 23138 / MP5ACTX9) TaxID=1198114 RepID=E8X0K5_GRATM|nr:diaminopimelate decarboxylase [Granulicella tundricola MP5ACTX9]
MLLLRKNFSRSSPIATARPFAYRNRALSCDQTSLATLAATHGTPLYVYSQQHILGRLALFQQAFASRPHTICYAVKANSALAILKLLAQNGAGFDIVSGGELARVVKAAKPAVKKTVFAGVGKQIPEIDAALKAGILLFNVESESELALLADRAELLKIPARFSLRVNPDVFAETHPYISTGLSAHKFGIDINAARAIYRKAAKSKYLIPTGVSVHIGSQIRAVDPFGAALDRVTSLIQQLKKDGITLTHIDAGGGLGIEYTDAPFDPAAAVAAYAKQVLEATDHLDLHLLLEPGRFLVAQAGALLTTVVNVKKNGNKTFVITDAGMNDLIRPALYQAHHQILPVRQTSAKSSPVDIVGPVCESGDFFARDRDLPATKPGDLLAILDAGAYGMSLTSNYNTRTRPPEVLVDGAESRLIRRRETIKDLFAPELP